MGTVHLKTKDDLQSLNQELRNILCTANGVPISLQCSASYLNFRVKCLQALNHQNTCIPNFEAYLDYNITLQFENNIVSIYRSVPLDKAVAGRAAVEEPSICSEDTSERMDVDSDDYDIMIDN